MPNAKWFNEDGNRMQCLEDDCLSDVHVAGLCRKHYSRSYQRGERGSAIKYEDRDGNRLVCATLDCEEEVLCRNMCEKHYKRAVRTGTTQLLPKTRWNNPDGSRMECEKVDCKKLVVTGGFCATHYREYLESKSTCTVEGCESGVTARGWCEMHYRRWKKHGSTDKPMTRTEKGCTVCGGKYYSRGWCYEHYTEQKRAGNIDGVKTCSFEGCDNWAKTRGLCSTHWAQDDRGAQLKPVKQMVVCSRAGCEKETFNLLCANCNKTRWRYSLTPERFLLMFQPENRICSNIGCNSTDRLHIDHDHSCCDSNLKSSGEKVSCGACVRGWLCGKCNAALGMVNDNPEKLLGLLDYLGH